MLSDVSYANAIPHAANMKEAIATYHPFQNYESLASLHGVVAFRFKHAAETAPENITFAPLHTLQRALHGQFRIKPVEYGNPVDIYISQCVPACAM